MSSKALVLIWSVCWALSLVTPGEATERRVNVGLHTSTALVLEPDVELGDTFLGLDFAVFFSDYIAFLTQADFALNGVQEKLLAFGLKAYPSPYQPFRWFAGASGVWQFDPRADGGLRGFVGIDWDLTDAMGIYLVNMSIETGGGALFREPSTIFWDIFRLGIGFSL